ncbi:carbohydrate kinase [Maribacter sp. PR1]|uniref:Carbohydrate kinase n=1 Tax=Maribacter cobaltidurans TaxID=1178778 RepID=A0ABU7IR88_9FLAO|nr:MULTISPECIES: carbohydrate kinase [Maribacter]MDC6388032.1 carbohydrate kinase [Maribacter sp. PR1]MEE1975420.1 carbohydrate kinase [Maribacter cobaltidurans]
MKKVFCIGELLIDFVAENQGKNLSKAKEFTKKAGGAPANVACAISKLEGKSVFVGCVGDDPFGNFLLNVLEENNVDTTMAQKSVVFTTLAFVSIDDDGERDFVFSRGADKELKYDPALKKEFKNNMVHFGAATAMLGGNLEEAYNRFFFDALTKDSFISFDPNYREDLWKKKEDVFIKKCMPFIQKSHLGKFSLEEAQLLSGKEDLNEACSVLHETGVAIIVVTLGKEGTLLSTKDFSKTIPSIEVAPVDTTGAGDSFIGCLLKQISTHDSLEALLDDETELTKMVAMANKAGAITTTNFGAIESLPTQKQLDT